MAIRLISGSWPPDVCGVGDHIDGLRKSLLEKGVEVVPVRLSKYSAFKAIMLVLRSWLFRNDRAVLAYPTEGYGRSVVPFLLAMSRPGSLLIHIHEYGSKNVACRWLLRLFRLQSALYFSNTADKQRFMHDTGIVDKNGRVIKVLPSPSNIAPLTLSDPTNHRGAERFLHFGQIRPNKGIEQVLAVFKHLRRLKPTVQLTLAGAVPVGYETFAAQISAIAAEEGIDLHLGLEPVALSKLIAEADVMFLPYPGGADEKRGTLAAGLAHGTVCVTTYGPHTTDLLRSATVGVEPVADAQNEHEWIERSVQVLLSTAERAREGKTADLASAALRYTSYASFANLAEQSLDTLYRSNVS
jgi:glycosyltransferase involved in cell wall biosynthesis